MPNGYSLRADRYNILTVCGLVSECEPIELENHLKECIGCGSE